MIDTGNVQYKVVEYSWGSREGLFKIGTNDRHGPIRYTGDGLSEYTAKNDEWHGLRRKITDSRVYISLFDNGNQIAYLRFDHNFVGEWRDDPNGYFDDITPDYWRLE